MQLGRLKTSAHYTLARMGSSYIYLGHLGCLKITVGPLKQGNPLSNIDPIITLYCRLHLRGILLSKSIMEGHLVHGRYTRLIQFTADKLG